MNLDREINAIVTRTAKSVAAAVRAEIANDVAKLVGAAGRITGARARKRKVILCPVKNCGKRGGGPKWQWFCKSHKDLPAGEKAKARKNRARPSI